MPGLSACVECLKSVNGKGHFPAHDSTPDQESSRNRKLEWEEGSILRIVSSIG